MGPKEMHESTKVIGYNVQVGVGRCSPEFRRTGLEVNVKHKSDSLELSKVNNSELLGGPAIPGPKHSAASTIFIPSSTLPKILLAIQPLSLGSIPEDLETICVGSSICHGQGASTHMLQDEIHHQISPLR